MQMEPWLSIGALRPRRDVSDRPRRQSAVQAHLAAFGAGLAARLPAADSGAMPRVRSGLPAPDGACCAMTRFVAIFAAVLLTTALHAADDANFDDPALAAALLGFDSRDSLPALHEREHRRFRRACCRRPSPRSASTARRRQERRRHQGLHVVALWGDFILYRPRVTPLTYALWGGPFVLLVVGSLVFWRILRARRDQPLGEDEPT